MSSVTDTILSSVRNRVFTVLLITMLTACLSPRQPNAPSELTDRLLNLLIQNQLPLSSPESALRSEVERCGQWLRTQLQADSGEIFRFDSDDNRIIAVKAGRSRLLVPELFQHLEKLNAYFHLNSAVPRSLFSSDSVQQLLLHSRSRTAIEELIRQDSEEMITEIGGIVTVPPQADFLEFHVIDSENARLVRRLQAITSPKDFARELTLILPSLPYLRVRAQRTIDILASKAGASSDQQQEDAIESFMDLLLYYSKHSYILDQGTQYATIAEAGIFGFYMGVFHVHPPGNPPSMEDKVGSLLRKNFVIVPETDHVQIHYLDFSADPASEPDVFRFDSAVNTDSRTHTIKP